MAGKRRVDHAAVVEYAKKHPEMLQDEIGEVFGLTQSHVSKILREGGASNPHRARGGAVCRRKPGQTRLEYEWEVRLSREGLGMDRGLKIAEQRILYGEDPRKERESALFSP
jgi:hypothetical protein